MESVSLLLVNKRLSETIRSVWPRAFLSYETFDFRLLPAGPAPDSTCFLERHSSVCVARTSNSKIMSISLTQVQGTSKMIYSIGVYNTCLPAIISQSVSLSTFVQAHFHCLVAFVFVQWCLQLCCAFWHLCFSQVHFI